MYRFSCKALILTLLIGSVETATFVDILSPDFSYPFTLTQGDEVAQGHLEINDKGFYWSTDHINDPNLWVDFDRAVILDSPFQTATIWSLQDFEQLHPFISAWSWLADVENEIFSQKQGELSLCHKSKGCFHINWGTESRKVSWNGGEVTLSIDTDHRIKQRQFDFQIPPSWDIEFH